MFKDFSNYHRSIEIKGAFKDEKVVNNKSELNSFKNLLKKSQFSHFSLIITGLTHDKYDDGTIIYHFLSSLQSFPRQFIISFPFSEYRSKVPVKRTQNVHFIYVLLDGSLRWLVINAFLLPHSSTILTLTPLIIHTDTSCWKTHSRTYNKDMLL